MNNKRNDILPDVPDPDQMDTVSVDNAEIFDISNEFADGGLSVKYAASSIIGTRDYQQDAWYADRMDHIVIGVVCDGMGGLEGGEKASQTAISILVENFCKWCDNEEFREEKIPSFLEKTASKMDKAVSGLKNDRGEFMDAGTTTVAAVAVDNRLYWLSVGDSRIYHIRGNHIRRITRDHNVRLLIDEQRRKGTISEEEYRRKEKQAEALVSYIGMGGLRIIDTNIDGNPIILEENDIILVCSDGLYKRLGDKEIAEIVYCEEPEMDRAARRLTDVVNERTVRNQDNTTVVLMQYNKFMK